MLQVPGLSIDDDNLEPKLAWLKARLKLDDHSVSRLVQKLPAVLGYNIEQNVAWLKKRLELDDKGISKLAKTERVQL